MFREKKDVFELKTNHHTEIDIKMEMDIEQACAALSFELACSEVPFPEQLSAKYYSPLKKSPKVYSKQIFLGGLPPDINAAGILQAFKAFRPINVDWPGKSRDVNCVFPPRGFAFLYFPCEESVHLLMKSCLKDGEHYYFPVTSRSMEKLTQVRPWRIEDSEVIIDPKIYTVPHYPVFVGGIPRCMTAVELATIMMRRFGNVGYVGLFLDTQTNYPRGFGAIFFTNKDSYAAAIHQHYVVVDDNIRSVRFVELKPYNSFSSYCGLGTSSGFFPVKDHLLGMRTGCP